MTGCTGPTDCCTVTGAVAVALAGVTAGLGQSAMLMIVDAELELPSRVCAAVHDDDAFAVPSPVGIATVSENVLPGNDALPRIMRPAPLGGSNTTTHAGAFHLAFPCPDALKAAQSKVTDPQVAVAVTVSAPALAAKIASIAIASGMTHRERRTIAPRIPTVVGPGASLSLVMLALLSIGRVLALRCLDGKGPREATSDEELCRSRGAGYRLDSWQPGRLARPFIGQGAACVSRPTASV
jgi:hypothetical protein